MNYEQARRLAKPITQGRSGGTTMSELNIWRCDSCGHIFNPEEPRWGINATATGQQKCRPCAKSHNARALFLNAMRLNGPRFTEEDGW